ncbi:DEAD/DEAH box helicase [Caldiplasma sukawensis]
MVNLFKKLKYEEMTEAQELFAPVVFSGRDAILISPTGSGKTEAVIFPIFSRILEEEAESVACLYITPLRALNRDMFSRIESYGRELSIRVQVRHSDISISERKKIMENPAHIIITTPESLQILLNSNKLRSKLKNLRWVIVDELHELAQNERGAQLSIALERLKEIAPNFQRLGLSATVGNPSEIASFLNPNGQVEIVKTGLHKDMEFTIEIPDSAPDEIANKMACDSHYAGAVKRIYEYIMNERGTIVFVNTRSVAEDLAFRMKLYYGDIPVLVHHGSLSRETREDAEQKFKKGEIKALIATSSLELGIDIGTADLVIQFNSPRQINKLVQRIGRSGHSIYKKSKGVIICTDVIELEEAMAIISQVKAESLEPVSISKKSIATVVNQIMLETRIWKVIELKTLFQTIKNAYCGRFLNLQKFNEILNFLNDSRKIRFDGERIFRSAASLDYFISNISMIPSEKNYRVIDSINRKFVGTLDEKYVVNEISPGSYFVIKGSTWRVMKIEEERIYVEPFPTAALAPKWTGEDIPVLMDVVDRVSQNRKLKFIGDFVEKKSADLLTNWYNKRLAEKDRIIIEVQNSEIIIQILLGTKGNFTMSQILSSILSSITNESVEADYSPYHIYFRVSRRMSPSEIESIIRQINPELVLDIILKNARRSRFFSGIFLYEVRKFGIIKPDADLSRVRFEKIIESYENSVLFEDSINKMIYDYMDIEAVRSFILSINDIKIEKYDHFSEGSEYFLTHFSERINPIKPTKAIIDSVRERLLNEEITLLCMKCHWTKTDRVKNQNSMKCLNCGNIFLAVLSPYQRDGTLKLLDSNRISEREKKSLMKSAYLYKERGREALIALAARGVGPETASRLLQVRYFNEDDLILEIIKSENDYAKNRRYWD